MTQWNDQPDRPGRAQPGYGEPGYGQPGYGQPGYVQPAAYGQPGYVQPAPGQPGYGQPANRFEQSESFGIVGTVLTLLGGIIVVVAFTALPWLKGSVSFSDLHDRLVDNPHATGFASAYFGWLGWAFLIVVVIAGVLASVPTNAMRIFRIIGVVTGLAAAGLSFLAVQLTESSSYLDYLKAMRIGFYFAVAGFLLAGIGAAIGPHRD